jgi:hypothetical protein
VVRQRNVGTLADFLAGPIRLLNFEADDGREAGEIRATLERVGTPIGPYLRHSHRRAGAERRAMRCVYCALRLAQRHMAE